MRKRIPGPSQVRGQPQTGQGWLDLEQIATIELTSEEPDFPIESVFNSEDIWLSIRAAITVGLSFNSSASPARRSRHAAAVPLAFAL
jgi:hypothetical protein